MQLSDYIRESLVAIFDGVREANRHLNSLYERGEIGVGAINPVFHDYSEDMRDRVSKIEFDVATVVKGETEKGGDGKIEVLGVSIGAAGTVASGTETASRVKFSVDVVLPVRPVSDSKSGTT